MTSYRYVAVQDDDPFELDRNQNITKRTEVLDFSQTRLSDDDDRVETRSTVIRVRSQSLKHLNERVETGSISRSKSLRDVDASGEFASVKARVSYVDSWNPVNPVGRGRIAERVKSWENNLDEEEAGSWRERKTFSSDNGMDRRKVSYNGTRARGYDNYYGSGEPDWRNERYESYQYNRDSAENLYGARDEVRYLDCAMQISVSSYFEACPGLLFKTCKCRTANKSGKGYRGNGMVSYLGLVFFSIKCKFVI